MKRLVKYTKAIDVLSLGMGRQSIYLLLKSLEDGKGPDHAIFSDLGSEPKKVYEYAKWLQDYLYLKHGFRLTVIKPTSLYQSLLDYVNGDIKRASSIPMFTKNGIVNRQCTMDYKILPIRRKIREMYSEEKKLKVNMWFGISFDERERMKTSTVGWITNLYPLVDDKTTISQIIQWFGWNDLPVPIKSSCLFCPFHSDKYWYELLTTSPEDFELACLLDEAIRHYPQFNELCYLHRSCKPLREIDFVHIVESQLKLWPELIEECHGYCGT